jgi:hypothetical protein
MTALRWMRNLCMQATTPDRYLIAPLRTLIQECRVFLAFRKATRLRATPCETIQWAREESNLRPHPYQGCALAN